MTGSDFDLNSVFGDLYLGEMMNYEKREVGGEIVTFASDAHFTAHVGAYCDRTMRILRELGFRYVAVYENRKPVFHKIEF
jgi:hypothetical protein